MSSNVLPMKIRVIHVLGMLLPVMIMLTSGGCLSDAHRLEQGRFREVLLSLTEEQIMDNLIRTYNHRPIVQMAYTNITGLIKGDIVGMFNGSQTDIAGAITNMFAYSATNTFGNSLSVTANPVIDGGSLVKTASKITGGKEDATFRKKKSIYRLYYEFVNGTSPVPTKAGAPSDVSSAKQTPDVEELPTGAEMINGNADQSHAILEEDSADGFEFKSRETILHEGLRMLVGLDPAIPSTRVQGEDQELLAHPLVDVRGEVVQTNNSITIDATRLTRAQVSWLPKLVVTNEEPLGPGRESKPFLLSSPHYDKDVYLNLSGNYIQKRKGIDIHTGESTYFWIPIEFGIDYFQLSLRTSVGLGDLARTNALSQPILSELTLQRLGR